MALFRRVRTWSVARCSAMCGFRRRGVIRGRTYGSMAPVSAAEVPGERLIPAKAAVGQVSGVRFLPAD